MSLNWDLSEIEDHKTRCWIDTGETDAEGEKQYRLNAATEALIWATISVGIGKITEDNAGEFYGRLYIIESCHGPMLVGKDGPQCLTIEDVRAHIGLRCNVSYETREEWAMRMFVGFGDSLKSYGEKLMDEDEQEQARDTRAGLLHTCAGVLYDHGNANVAGVGRELEKEAERIGGWKSDVSITTERARYFRSEQRKAATNA